MVGPSEHLTWDELKSSDGAPYPEQWRDTRAVDLGFGFEAFREECGGVPLHVLSGYRTPERNADVPNSASKSQHMLGTAIDIARPNQIVVYGEFVAAAFRARERCELIKGIGVYPQRNSIHLDVRSADYLAFWTG